VVVAAVMVSRAAMAIAAVLLAAPPPQVSAFRVLGGRIFFVGGLIFMLNDVPRIKSHVASALAEGFEKSPQVTLFVLGGIFSPHSRREIFDHCNKIDDFVTALAQLPFATINKWNAKKRKTDEGLLDLHGEIAFQWRLF
jgi:hypothetical protein